MQSMVNTFARRAVAAQVVLIFYAGHGVQVDGQSYLLPIDIGTAFAEGPAAKAVSLDTILSGLDDKATRRGLSGAVKPLQAHDLHLNPPHL